MSITVSPTRIKGKERQEILEAVQKQIKEAALQASRQVIMACLEAEVTAKLGREKGRPRQVGEQVHEIDWKCGHCGCQNANQFTRDGHSQRTLEPTWGHSDQVRVPMLECQNCQHDVICQFSMLEKFQRWWVDLQQDAFFSSGLGQSLRAIRNRWSGELERPVGLRTMNEVMNQVEPRVASPAGTPCPRSTHGGPMGWHVGQDPGSRSRNQARHTSPSTPQAQWEESGDLSGPGVLARWQTGNLGLASGQESKSIRNGRCS
jgi:hypothetical protein